MACSYRTLYVTPADASKMFDRSRLEAAYSKAREDLLSQRNRAGHWVGRLCSSPLSTATALSALVLAEQHCRRANKKYVPENAYQGDLSEQIVQSLNWLADQQNEDGGWGDTDRSLSNIATTMLVHATFSLTGVPARRGNLLERAEAYIKKQGGIRGLRRRYGRDKTFAVPILTNCALAETVHWRQVSQLPFELACLPQSWYRLLRLPVVSYAIPALVAIGQSVFYHRRSLNPITWFIRKRACEPSLKVLEKMQPESGGFLEAVPLTSFVVMSLASIGQADSRVARQGVEFLLSTMRSDGSWPIDSNLATWNTTLALNALASAGEEISSLDCLDWVLECQHREVHPFTGAEPGGWAWTDLSGGVPDVDDTSGALLTLKTHWLATDDDAQKTLIVERAAQGAKWLLSLQNSDGGWPTFCRGWGKLPFDRSGCDLTAHAIRALLAWRNEVSPPEREPAYGHEIDDAVARGFAFLSEQQRGDGSWLPLWFGNQHGDSEENPIYGTAKVLLAYRDAQRLDDAAARAAIASAGVPAEGIVAVVDAAMVEA
ncbi:MAG: squalene--hopene cyclase, partial [Planctomycetales bacterium]|nr:squalene--hopene cyclase [Planctomycetales bacterium]